MPTFTTLSIAISLADTQVNHHCIHDNGIRDSSWLLVESQEWKGVTIYFCGTSDDLRAFASKLNAAAARYESQGKTQ